jgi:hypothetical protein
MKCVTYARVSTDRQADKGPTIPAQLQAMRQHARDRGWEIKEEFVESGASARPADRPALRALLSTRREPGAKIDVVLVHKIDRLARNLADHLALKGILKERGIALTSARTAGRSLRRPRRQPGRSDGDLVSTVRTLQRPPCSPRFPKAAFCALLSSAAGSAAALETGPVGAYYGAHIRR